MGLTQQLLKTASPSPRKRRAVAEAGQLCALPDTVAQFFRHRRLPVSSPLAAGRAKLLPRRRRQFFPVSRRPRQASSPRHVLVSLRAQRPWHPPARDRFSAGGDAASPTPFATGLRLAPTASSPAADGLAKRRVRER
ncbi:Os02g0145951 [Oryza sativa Japonica Group]|uniref:Os02g0145951 protein n=1 Tax=Oryza sativa subsp. japonica TaxID=39947 RepID=A0A0P0VES9_ORYSJ|nr:Os02g0145951 [Oryza sativa Japonica Group]